MGVECRDTVEFQGGLSAESQPTTKDDHLPAQLPVGTALSKSLSAMYLKSHGPLVFVYIYIAHFIHCLGKHARGVWQDARERPTTTKTFLLHRYHSL